MLLISEDLVPSMSNSRETRLGHQHSHAHIHTCTHIAKSNKTMLNVQKEGRQGVRELVSLFFP